MGTLPDNTVFGEDFTNITESQLNINSAFPYNPERWQMSVNGSRVFPEYNSVAQYEHTGKRHRLKPNSGDTVFFRTAERPRYPVGFEIAVSFALRLNKNVGQLTGDDRIRGGIYDGSDGWCVEHNATHAKKHGDLLVFSGGNDVQRVTDINFKRLLTDFYRRDVRTAWYDVARQLWGVSYAINGRQINRNVGKTGKVNQGPETPQLPVAFEVRADQSTSDLELDVGSLAYISRGPGGNLLRTKPLGEEYSINTTGSWVPVAAFRQDPSFGFINIQIPLVSIVDYDTDSVAKIGAFSFHKDHVTFTGGDSWGKPPEWSDSNSAMQRRQDVDQIYNASGSLETNPTNPGGFILNYDVAKGSKNQGNTTALGGIPGEVKSNLTENRIAVLCANVQSNGNIIPGTLFSQDW